MTQLVVKDNVKILIVDDQVANISVLSDTLSDLAEIYFTTNGEAALQQAAALQPELILLDIEMPGMNGFEVCQQLKSDPNTADIAVIFISAHEEAQFEFHSLAYGGIDFIHRPFNRAICRLRVQNHLLLRQQAKALILSKEALFVEKQRLLVTLNSIGDAVIATDTAGIVTYMNPIAERMTGWRQRDAIGCLVTQVMDLRDADSHQPSINPIELALTERRIVAMALNCELISLDGQACHVEDSAAPILDSDGNMLGAIIVFHDVSEALALANKMSHLANHDQLTGLPNRILLHDRIHQACRQAAVIDRKIAVMLIDIDRFKFLNDSLGHKSGDELILQLAKRLQSILDPDHTLARIGGDEFVLVSPDILHIEQISILAQRLVRLMQQPFEIDCGKYNMSLSIGISVYPIDADNEEALMRHADVAMYKAKQEGRNRYCFFSDELGDIMLQRHLQEQQLREAINNNRLEVYYQPKNALASECIIGAEALVRIRNLDGSLMPPADFIPLAEETGLIVPLGKQVLVKACLQAAQWQEQGFTIPVSVNIAAAQFADPSIVKLVQNTLLECRLPAELLELEVTESALMLDASRTADLLQQFHSLGVSIAIDDFGTGYSSLAYLKRFHVDVLKIDMSFVKDMLTDENDLAIVRTVISLGKSLNIALVAEGIETAEHRLQLLEMGCESGQGYLYSKPLPENDFIAYLRSKFAKDSSA